MASVRLLCLLGLALLLAGGCGATSSGDGSTPSKNRSKASSSEVAGASQITEASLIRQGDLPEEWQQQGGPIAVRLCGVNPFQAAAAVSDSHYVVGLTDLQHQVAVFSSPAAARSAYSRLTSNAGYRCLKKGFESEVVAESGGPILKSLRVLQAKSFGASAEGRRVVMKVESPIGPVSVYSDLAFAQARRIVSFLKVSSGVQPVSIKLFEQMARLAMTRAQAVQG